MFSLCKMTAALTCCQEQNKQLIYNAAWRTDEHVLGLHVAVDDAVAVEVVQRANQLHRYGPHLALREAAVILQHLKQLACGQAAACDIVLRLQAGWVHCSQ